MWPFRRRRRGRHELGAGPCVPVLTDAAPVRPSSYGLLAPASLVPVPRAPRPDLVRVAVPRFGASPPGSTVRLGFLDGSTTDLPRNSAEARALEQLARNLTQGPSL